MLRDGEDDCGLIPERLTPESDAADEEHAPSGETKMGPVPTPPVVKAMVSKTPSSQLLLVDVVDMFGSTSVRPAKQSSKYGSNQHALNL